MGQSRLGQVVGQSTQGGRATDSLTSGSGRGEGEEGTGFMTPRGHGGGGQESGTTARPPGGMTGCVMGTLVKVHLTLPAGNKVRLQAFSHCK